MIGTREKSHLRGGLRGRHAGGSWTFREKNMPAANLSELIAWLKTNPDKASAGTPGQAQRAM